MAQKTRTRSENDGTELKIKFGTKFLFHVLQPTLKISERNGTSFQILPGTARKSGTRSKINGTERTAFQILAMEH